MSKKTIACAAILLAACSSGSGTLTITASGEQAAEGGWPFTVDGETIEFADGWSIDVDRVLVSVGDLTLAGSDGERAVLSMEPAIVDLTHGPIEIDRFLGVPARRWDRVGYRLALATASARRVGTVADADVATMVSEGLVLMLDGTAHHETHGDYSLHIGVPFEVQLSHCVSGEDGTDGIVVPSSGAATGQLTFHLDHFFFDSLAEAAPPMRFEAWAATADASRRVTIDGLASQRLADMRGVDGTPLRDESGALLAYDPGALRLPAQDLREFVLASAATVGHWQGEGHCDYAAAR